MLDQEMIEESIKLFNSKKCDSLLSVSKKNLKIGDIKDNYFLPRYRYGQQSRLTNPTYFENGLIYISKSKVLDEFKSLSGKKTIPFLTYPPFDEVDLDEESDFLIGESIFSIVKKDLNYIK